MLDARSPAVITTRRVPRPPWPMRHRNDVSDSHSVPSHAVCRSRALLVLVMSPMPDPCTVTDADPVLPRLPRRSTLLAGMSADQAWLLLPIRSPVVNTTRRVPRAPCPTRHLTDVSDSQSVPSHLVCPCLEPIEYARNPMLEPCKVIDVDPVPARLARRAALTIPTSYDQEALALPSLLPTVITTRRVPRVPCPAMHLTDVSDSHSVPSHIVLPSRARPVYVASPRLDPCIVTETDPVPAAFIRLATLNAGTSTDQA